MKDQHHALWALHRYFIWADRMRVHFERFLSTGRSEYDQSTKHKDLEALLYLSYWYASMYVVIEGWKELGLSDPEVDALLESENVQLLKRYRNGVFHFQTDYLDDRFFGFMEAQGTVSWIRSVRESMSRFFLGAFDDSKGTS